MAMPLKSRRTKGNLNRLIDDMMHPYFKDHPALILADGLLHAAVEKNPRSSLTKFVKYNVPILLTELGKRGTSRTKKNKTEHERA